MKKCNECGKQYEGNFCPYCGAKWTEEKATERVCPDCGETVAPGMRFCANCGYDFTGKKSSDDVKAEKKVQAAILRTANFMEAIPTMLRVGNAVLSTIFSVLLWILFALPVTTILEETLGNLYQFMNGTTELGELIEPVKAIGWVIFLAVVALGCALYTLYACVTERKEEKAHTRHWVLNLVFLVFHVIFFIVGCIVRSRITGYGLTAGACANSLMICSPIFFVLSLTLTVVSFFLAAKAKAPLTPEEVAAKEAKKAALIEKAKKIAKPVGALGACALAIVIIVSISTNIFRAGKVDNIAIGADAATVLDILGEPYCKDGKAEYSRAGSDTVWKYYSKNYTKIYDKITELEEKTENMASLGELGSILEEGLALEEKALALRYKYIEVAFKDGAVVAVYFDKMKCDSDTESKQLNVSSVNLDKFVYSEFSNASTFTEEKQLQVKYSDGNYLLDTLTVHAEKPSSNYTDGKITWRDAFGEHAQSIGFVSRPAAVGDVKLVETEKATYKYTLLSFDDQGVGNVLLEVAVEGEEVPDLWSALNYEYRISVVLTEGVTTIGERAFNDCVNLTSITIPSSVTTIGERAFNDCVNLTSITIPSSVTTIGDGAFSGCTSLTSINIPASVTTIGSNAFSGCTSLTNFIIPEGVKGIGDNLFSGCTSLASITIPDSVDYIGWGAFSDCTSLESVRISDLEAWCEIIFSYPDVNPLLYAGNLYINDKLVTSLVIPSSVTEISSRAFSGCTSLTSITFGENSQLTTIDGFSGCTSLKSITIPDSVTTIVGYAFEGCTSLTSITFGENSKLTTIGFYAFMNCTSLTSITIPDSVTKIGEEAFSGCTNLQYNEYEGLYYLGNSTNPYLYLAKAGSTSITSCVIHPSARFIPAQVFQNCTSLTSITIPSSVTTIGNKAFSGCKSLTSITFGGTKAQWNNISKSWYWNHNTPTITVTCTDGTVTEKYS